MNHCFKLPYGRQFRTAFVFGRKQFSFLFLSNNEIISLKKKTELNASFVKQISWNLQAAAEKPIFLIGFLLDYYWVSDRDIFTRQVR